MPEAGPHRPKGLLGGVGKLMLSRGLSLVLALITAPIVSRLFSPEDFGVYGAVVAAGGWAAAFACLGYHQAIPLARSDSEVNALVKLCLALSGGLSALCWLPVILWPGQIARLMGGAGIEPYLYFAPLLFIVASFAGMAEYILSQMQSFGRLAVVNFITTNLTRALTIAWGAFLGGSALGLLWGNLGGALASIALAACFIAPALARRSGSISDPQPVSMRRAAKEHAQFPKVQMWNWVLSASTQSFPVLLLGGFFDAAIVGLFVFARNIAQMPRRIISTSVSQVFYPQAAKEWQTGGTMVKSISSGLRLVGAASVFPMLCLVLIGPFLFEFVFGARWREAGVYAQIMAAAVLLDSLSGPFTNVFLVRTRADLMLKYNLALVILRLGGLALGGWLGDARLALGLYTAAGALVLLHRYVLSMRMGGAGGQKAVNVLLREGLHSAATLLPAALAAWAKAPAWIALALLALGAAVYFLLLCRRDKYIGGRVKEVLSALTGRGG